MQEFFALPPTLLKPGWLAFSSVRTPQCFALGGRCMFFIFPSLVLPGGGLVCGPSINVLLMKRCSKPPPRPLQHITGGKGARQAIVGKYIYVKTYKCRLAPKGGSRLILASVSMQEFFATRRRPEALRAWRLPFPCACVWGWALGCSWVDGFGPCGQPRDHCGASDLGVPSSGTGPT